MTHPLFKDLKLGPPDVSRILDEVSATPLTPYSIHEIPTFTPDILCYIVNLIILFSTASLFGFRKEYLRAQLGHS